MNFVILLIINIVIKIISIYFRTVNKLLDNVYIMTEENDGRGKKDAQYFFFFVVAIYR